MGITGTKTISAEYMALKRDTDRIALIQQEDAARTQRDFERLVLTYDRLNANRERRERRHEIKYPEDLVERDFSDGDIIPVPLGHRWWRAMMKGNFLDVIFECPYEIQELTSSRPVYELVGSLNAGQKEVLYGTISGWNMMVNFPDFLFVRAMVNQFTLLSHSVPGSLGSSIVIHQYFLCKP